MVKNMAVITAAGKGRRFKAAKPKQFVKVGGKEILAYAIINFEKNRSVGGMLITVPRGYKEYVKKHIIKKYGLKKVKDVIEGGKDRCDSVYRAVGRAAEYEPENLLIHDGARPVFDKKTINKVIKRLEKFPAVVPVSKISSTVKLVSDNRVLRTMDRKFLRAANTPQGFKYAVLREIYTKQFIEKYKPTDEAFVFESKGYKVGVVEEKGLNLKITTKNDIEILRHKFG